MSCETLWLVQLVHGCDLALSIGLETFNKLNCPNFVGECENSNCEACLKLKVQLSWESDNNKTTKYKPFCTKYKLVRIGLPPLSLELQPALWTKSVTGR
jgi:hypothetical protein